MINRVLLKNFKCFHDEYFKFAPLTVFCGSNSAGKSTVIQSILSIKQNQENLDKRNFKVNGNLFSFGTVKDLISHHSTSNQIDIEINDFSLKLIAENLDQKECKIDENEISNLQCLDFLFSNDFIYLCAERFGPRSSFELGDNSNEIDVGIFGQFALSLYHKNQDKLVKNHEFAKKVCKNLLDEKPDSPIFMDALVQEAMRKIYPSFSMKVSEVSEIDRVYNMYSSGSEKIRPINVGFGVSYVLPIIISAALIKPGGTLIVENPEVHLHPSAQSELIKLLCDLSLSDVQVIVETHSDHIINGIRVYAKDNDFCEKNNIVHSISEKLGTRTVTNIHIDKDGNLTALDDGFFDQINKDLMRLF